MSEPIDPREQFGEHGEWDALAVGWALSALDPEDEERFAEHLPGCARCTATVRESLYTVADLAYALPDEAPPPALKSRLMAAVGAEPRTPGAAPEPEVAPAEPEPEEEWPLGEPHPGSPGYGIDWFAKPPRSTETPSGEPETHQPPVGDGRTGTQPPAGWPVAEPTIGANRPDLTGPPTPGDEVDGRISVDLDREPADYRDDPRTDGDEDQPTGPRRPPADHRGDLPEAGTGATSLAATDLAGTDRGATDRGATEGGATDRGATEGGATESDATESDATEGGATDGGATDGGATHGGATDRGATDLGATDLGVTDLGVTDRAAAHLDMGDRDVTDRDVADRDVADRDVTGSGEGAEVVRLASRRRRLARRIGVGVGAAAVLALIAGLVAWNVDLRNQRADLRQIAAQREAAIQELTASGPARVAALTADGKPSPERRATLVVRGDRIEIITETLGATTGNETYWLWTLRCDTQQATDLKPIRWFTVAQSEFSVRDIGSDPGVAGAPCFAISSELGKATPKAPRQVVAVGQAE